MYLVLVDFSRSKGFSEILVGSLGFLGVLGTSWEFKDQEKYIRTLKNPLDILKPIRTLKYHIRPTKYIQDCQIPTMIMSYHRRQGWPLCLYSTVSQNEFAQHLSFNLFGLLCL